MVAFTGNGLVRTAKPASNQQQNNNKPQISDRLVTVENYDLARNIVRVKQDIVTKDGEHKVITLEAHIEQEAIERNNASAKSKGLEDTVKFKGHLIDEKMAKDIPVGSKIVLEKSKILKKIAKDKEEYFIASAQRVINVPNPEPEKCFEGLFTVSAWENRIRFVQHWHDRAIDSLNTDALEGLKEQMEQAVATYGTTEHEKAVITPSVGIQLRAVMAYTDPQNPDVKGMVIDTSGALDWIPEIKDNSGQVVSKGHPLDAENFDNYLQGYTAHVEENFPSTGDTVIRVEVCPYFNYIASPMSQTLQLKDNRYDPVTQMATCKTRLSQDPESVVIGKNWAVKGIIQVSGDRMVREGKKVDFVPTFYVNKLHANNIKGHVHSWVNDANGGKTIPHKDLQRIREDLPQNGNGPARAPAQEDMSNDMNQHASSTDGLDLDDPFGDKPRQKV